MESCFVCVRVHLHGQIYMCVLYLYRVVCETVVTAHIVLRTRTCEIYLANAQK